MGAAQSMGWCGSWDVSVPMYQLVRLGVSEMQSLIVPDSVVQVCQLSAGKCVYMQDCLGRTFSVVLKKTDKVMLKYMGAHTWEVHVFDEAGGSEKFPFNGGSRAGYSTAGSSADPSPKPIFYNATGRNMDYVMQDFCTNISNAFDLEVPLYYTRINSVSLTCDYLEMVKEYAENYIVPLLRVRGCPEVVVLSLNGKDEPFLVKFNAYMGHGTVTMTDGLSRFLLKNYIEEDAEVVLHFVWQGDVINVYVYDF